MPSHLFLDENHRDDAKKARGVLPKHHFISEGSREPLPLSVTGLILCGGQSKRMGRDKAFLPYAGSTIIETLINRLRGLLSEILLVTNSPPQYSHLKVDIVKDILPQRGPLGGILSGLLVASNRHVLVVACDMPLASKKLIRELASARKEHDVVVLSDQGKIEPLLGVYSRACIPRMEAALFEQTTMQDFLAGLKANIFDYSDFRPEGEDLPAYFNVNTPQDYTEVLTRTALSHSRRS